MDIKVKKPHEKQRNVKAKVQNGTLAKMCLKGGGGNFP